MKPLLTLMTTFLMLAAFNPMALAQFDEAASQENLQANPADPLTMVPVTVDPNAIDPNFFDPNSVDPNANPAQGGTLTAPMIVGVIPSSQFKDFRHGIQFESTSGVTPGLKILQIDPMSLGQRNGLEVGDVILAVNGRNVSTQFDFENAFRTLPATVTSVSITVLNIRTGNPQPMRYELRTDAGSYQTNFGRIDLIQTPTNVAGVTLLEGKLMFYDGSISQVRGTLSGNTFRGTSTTSSRVAAPIELTKVGSMFDGTVTQGRPHRIVFVKRN